MIVRAVIDNPDVIDNFDYFNDGKDTIFWLKYNGKVELAERLQEKVNEWQDAYFNRLGQTVADSYVK